MITKKPYKRSSKHKYDGITASRLLKQTAFIPQTRLFPSQQKLIWKYQSFLSLNFTESEENSADGGDYSDLNSITAKIYLKNDSFAAYTDACLQTAEV